MATKVNPDAASAVAFRSTLDVTVSDILVHADIGVFAHEFGVPQPLLIDVVLSVEDVKDDDLDYTVDYNLILAYAQTLAQSRIALIETFATRLGARCMQHASVRRAEVMVKKPRALANGCAGTRAVLTR